MLTHFIIFKEGKGMTQSIFYLDDIYGISRDLPLNYVERKYVDDTFRRNLNRKKHVTIFGSSKQGKTCLRKHCLKDDEYILIQCNNRWSISELNANILKRAGYELTESTKTSMGGKAKLIASIKATLGIGGASVGSELEESHSRETTQRQLELDIDDVNDVIAALSEIHFAQYIVLEDFHYLRQDVQKDFSIELKAFHENSDLCFIIVGVWLDENKLLIYNGDLTGRIVSVNADEWHPDDLRRVILEGQRLLNIEFDESFINTLIAECFGNVYIVQEACHRICEENSIYETQNDTCVIGRDRDVKELVQAIVREQSGRYNAFLSNYSCGFQETTLEMHKWLLYPILTASSDDLLRGLSYRFIRNTLESVHPGKQELNAGNVTQALKAVVSLQLFKSIQPIILDYDESNLMLHVVDRGFIIWLNVQSKEDLFSAAGLPMPE